MDSPLKIRRILKIIGVIALLGVLIMLLLRYLNSGQVIITSTTPHNTITLVRLDEASNSEAKQTTAHNKLSKSVLSGTYVVSVAANSNQTNQLVKVSGRKTSSYHINPTQAIAVEPITSVTAQDLYAAKDELKYFNKSTGNLERIDSANGLTNPYTYKTYQGVKWAKSGVGIGQGYDGKLYKVTGTVVESLKVPFAYDKRKPIDYSVSGDQLYISSGTSVYSGSLNGSFKEIYKSTVSSPKLVAGNGVLAINKSGDEGSSGMTETIITPSGKATVDKLEIKGMAWSPNGRFLAASTEQGGVIYDSSQKTSTALPASATTTAFAWPSNGVLLYASSGSLWSYNTYSRQAKLIANSPLNEPIHEMVLDQDKSYAYITTASRSGKTTIRRVGLNGQPIPHVVYDLQKILPEDVGVCSLNYINFPSPTIIVSSSPRQATTQRCLEAAKADMKSYNIDPNSLRYISREIAGD